MRRTAVAALAAGLMTSGLGMASAAPNPNHCGMALTNDWTEILMGDATYYTGIVYATAGAWCSIRVNGVQVVAVPAELNRPYQVTIVYDADNDVAELCDGSSCNTAAVIDVVPPVLVDLVATISQPIADRIDLGQRLLHVEPTE